MFSRSLLCFQEQLPPYSLYDFAGDKYRNTDTHDLYNIQKRIIENEIQELRTNINNHLDKLVEDLLKDLTEAEKQITDETHELHVSLDEKQKKLSEYQTNNRCFVFLHLFLFALLLKMFVGLTHTFLC
jgi:hypothetical protein